MIKEEIKLVYLKLLRWLGLGDSFLYYIAGNDKLPAPLSEEEELKLLNLSIKLTLPFFTLFVSLLDK